MTAMAGETKATAPSDREQVLPPRPVELAGAEQLADEDQAQQRRGALKTSVEAEKPSTNIGKPARRNWRS